MSISDKILTVLLLGPFAARIGWMVLILPIQIAIGAFRKRGGRLPTLKPQRPAGKRSADGTPKQGITAGAQAEPVSQRADEDWELYTSTRPMQHVWYGDGNSDLDWRDRELGEALGFTDGDSYKSNWQ